MNKANTNWLHATTTNVPDITFEQIPGQFVWRRKLQTSTDTQQAPQPGSSRSLTRQKRPARAQVNALDCQKTVILSIPSYSWASVNYGKAGEPRRNRQPATPSKSAASTLRYLTSRPDAVDAFAFIKPPSFSATRFDAFEQLLLTKPELQPRVAVK